MLTEAKYYELSYLAKPELSVEEAVSLEEELRHQLDTFQATMDSWDSPRKRHLSYAIKKEREAYLGALRFTFPREFSQQLQDIMKKNKNILRFMLLQWRKTPPRRAPRIARPIEQKDEQLPTDEKALDEKLEEIFAKNV